MKKNVSIIIPAYNEALYIKETILAVKAFPEIKEIIVVDDGSDDDTEIQALKAGAIVHKNSNNLGKGSSLNIGITLSKGEILVFLDGDLGYTAKESVKLWRVIQQDQADCAIAKFPPVARPSGLGIVKKTASWGVRKFGGKEISAVLSGQRAFKRQIIEEIFPLGDGFGVELKTCIDLLKKGCRIKEVEVLMTHRVTGRSFAGFYHRGKQLRDILKTLFKEVIK